MPFFLKPCLKFRKKKKKNKSKAEETMKRVSDITDPVTNYEIWEECELDSSSSNLSENTDHAMSVINRNKFSTLSASPEICVIPTDESATNQNDEVSNQNVPEAISLEHIRIKRDEEFVNDFMEENSIGQLDTDIEKKESLDSIRTVRVTQVDDISETYERILEDSVENSDTSLNQEINDPNNLRFPDLNKIDVNTNVVEKIEELRYIENSFRQGDQSLFETIEEKNGKDISDEINGTSNKNAGTLIKHLNSHENQLNEIFSNVKMNLSNFPYGTFRDKANDEDSKTRVRNVSNDSLPDAYIEKSSILVGKNHANENFSEQEVYKINESNTPLKQKGTNVHDTDCYNESSSSTSFNNLTEPSEDVTEILSISNQKINNDSLNVKESVDINQSIIGGNQHSDKSVHISHFQNSDNNSIDDKNPSIRNEMCNYLKTDHTTNEHKNEYVSTSLSFTEMETLDFNTNAMVEQPPSLSITGIPVSPNSSSLPEEYRRGNSISRKIKEIDKNDKECNNDGIKLYGSNTGSIFLSNTNLEKYEIKNKNIEIFSSDTHERDFDLQIRQTVETKFEGNGLNVIKVDSQTNFKDYHVKSADEINKKSLVNDDDQISSDNNKCSHLNISFKKNEQSSEMNVHNSPPYFEEENSFKNNDISLSHRYILSDFIEKKNYCETLKNILYQEEPFDLQKDCLGEKNIDNYYENVSDKSGDINSSPRQTQSSTCNLYGKNDISHHISSCYDNKINHTSNSYFITEIKQNEDVQAGGKDFFVEEYQNSCTEKGEINYCIEENKTEEYENSIEANAAFKLLETSCTNSGVNIRTFNKPVCSISADSLKINENFELENSINPSKNTDFLYSDDNYTINNSLRTFKQDTSHHYDKSLYSNEIAEKISDYGKKELCGNNSSEKQVGETLNFSNTKSDEINKGRSLDEYENKSLDDIYENYYVLQNAQSPKRLNRFSNISSTSESSLSSRFSDKSCSKATTVKKKESRSFSISACGDSRNNESIAETNDYFKISQDEIDMMRIKNARIAVSRNEHHSIKREPKLTISITKKNKNDAVKNAQNINKIQAGDTFRRDFKSMDSSELDRIKESIEIFNKKKEQALSDMKPILRVIPIRKPEDFKISNNTKRIAVEQKTRSPFLKFSLNSNLNELHKNLSELMPETLLKTNKVIERDQTLHQINNIDEPFRKKETQLSFSSESETESPQTSESISPIRKRILNASREIRSPKYPFRTLQKMSLGDSHYLKRPVIIKSPKVNLVAYLTKDDKNVYQIKRGYRMFNHESGNYQIFSPSYRQSDYKTNQIENAVNNRPTSPDYLNPKFDDIFKRYARKGRSNGELISYKRSTEWLRDAGLIGKFLTAEEANNAFKITAGMKVALNKGDYRHYLKKLARVKRLNYNEIYKRLCSLNNR